MRHLRTDYNARIQDVDGKITDDEPVFIVRGRDAIAPAAIRAWADELASKGGEPHAVNRVRLYANEVEEWGRKNGAKLPDVDPSLLEPVGFLEGT